MNFLKTIFFIPIVESNLDIIFCKNNKSIFKGRIKCYKKNHIFFFIMSLMCLIIVFYLTYIFVIFSFNKLKNNYASIAKYIIMNSSKSFLFNKIIFLIIQGFDSIHSILGVKCVCIFLLTYIHLYCFILEYSYQDIQSANSKLYLYFNFTLAIASSLLFIGYIMKNKSFDGLIYVFFLFMIIMAGIIFIWPKQYLKYSIILHFSNDYIAYNQIRLFINSIKDRKYNRENLLEFLMFCSISCKESDKVIDEENFIYHLDDDLDYKMSKFIESTLKFQISKYNQSILLKCFYAIYLYEELFKYNKAFLVILSLYEDITQGKIDSHLSQEFYIYRLKRSLETNFINLSKNNEEQFNTELSSYYHINNFLYLILKNSEMYFEFWNLLFNCKEHKDIKTLEKLGNIINLQVKEIHEKFKFLYNKKLKNKKVIMLYIYFLRNVLNEYEISKQIFDKTEMQENEYEEINEIIGGNYKVYDLNEIESSSNLQFIISSGIKELSVGVIHKISHDFSKKLGYSSGQLIGKTINILLPDFLKDTHDKVVMNKFLIYKFKEEFKSPKKMKGLFFMKSNSMYLIPVYMETYFIFDEDYTPYNFTRLENDKEVFFHQSLYKTCHVATNKEFIIQNFTTNAITMLNLTDKDFNGTVDITSYIIELKKEIKELYLNKETEGFNEQMIKDILIREKYFLKNDGYNFAKNIITWKKNKKAFSLYCEEIKMNNELLGYYFHFEYYYPLKTNSSSVENFESILNEQKFLNKIPHKKIDSSVAISNTFGTEFQNGDFKINSNTIPLNEQIINFDYKAYSYVFKDTNLCENNKQKNYESMTTYVKSLFHKKYNKYNESMISSQDFSEENSYSKSFDSYTSNESLSENNKLENKKKSNISNSHYFNDYYKVNLDKVILYYYDFNKNVIQELKNFPKEDKIVLIMKEELKSKSKFSQRRDSRLSRMKKIKIKNPNESKLNENNIKLKNDETIKNETKYKINISIYFLLFSISITFFFQ